MNTPSTTRHWANSVVDGCAGVLLVVCITQPLAREGIGSATSLHELFDLLLGGTLRFGIPRWLGLFGYLPAFGGIAIMIAEATHGRLRTAMRVTGVLIATVSVTILTVAGPWNSPSRLGTGLWLAIAGVAAALVSSALELAHVIGASRSARTTAGELSVPPTTPFTRTTTPSHQSPAST